MRTKIELDQSNGKLSDMGVSFVTCHWPKQNSNDFSKYQFSAQFL